MVDNYNEMIMALCEKLLIKEDENSKRVMRNLVAGQNRIYTQLESLSWLQRRLSIRGHLPPLRGWAASPDVLLKLHAHIMKAKPNVVVEFGSGSTTMVIADALRQNGFGHLFSVEHSKVYADQTYSTLEVESLTSWVSLRVGGLQEWPETHMNTTPEEKSSKWYPVGLLKDIDCIDLLLVDGPPGSTCEFARYPALPALFERLSQRAQIWMDDTARQEEKDICKRWSDGYGLELEYFQMEKGLGVLKRY